MALVLAPHVLATLGACIITQKFTWLYLIPLVFGFGPGAIVTQSLREGRHEDNWGTFERAKAPVMYWFGVVCWSVFYLLSLALVIVLAYQLELRGEIPMRG
ncbi:hypothetical protein DES53_102127 [Roseimicrobium gellanilyticum]|uniref:Uncharacterized protein n=1 Tax=Roseimicrobium gellanilyticum TaxID=748857 RepID=A0A366HQ01_9BACT|nr:hypothetical protein [Roseimicrobium gellanilyticum]RBP45745.1 hypothetical protein DES53_102127 [Roseimicrobium gellanilyticum]